MPGLFENISGALGRAVGTYEAERLKARGRPRREPWFDAWTQHHRWSGGDYFADEEEAQKRALANSWAFSAAVMIASEVASAGFRVVKDNADPDGDPVEVTNHELVKRLRRPNPFMSRSFLWMYTALWLKLDGNAYWWLGMAGGKIAEIWPLPAGWVTPIPGDAVDFIDYYEYVVDGRVFELPPKFVVHFQNIPNPFNVFDGLSELVAGMLPIDADTAMARWNAKFFDKDNVMPSAIINMRPGPDGEISSADVGLFKSELKRDYQASERATYVTTAPGGLDVHMLGWAQRDMDFIAGRDKSRREVFEVFGIPEGMTALNATEANSKVGERMFKNSVWTRTLVPIAEQITAQVIEPFYGESLEGTFKDIRVANRELELQEIDRARGALTVNEVRADFFKKSPFPDPEIGGALYTGNAPRPLGDMTTDDLPGLLEEIQPREPDEEREPDEPGDEDLDENPENERVPENDTPARGSARAAEAGDLKAAGFEQGVMVAFFLPSAAAGALIGSLPPGMQTEPEAGLHVTLAYLGMAPEVQVERETVIGALAEFSRGWAPVRGTVGGYGRFTNAGDLDPVYASFDAPGLPDFRQEIVRKLEAAGVEVAKNHGFTPHITLAYITKDTPAPDLKLPALELEFGSLYLAWASDRYVFPLLGERKGLPEAAYEDLRRWKERDIRAFKRGKAPGEFESESIPADLYRALAGRLEGARSVEAIKAAFDFGPGYSPAELSVDWSLPHFPSEPAVDAESVTGTIRFWNDVFSAESGLLQAQVANRTKPDVDVITLIEPSERWTFDDAEKIYAGNPGTPVEGRRVEIEQMAGLRDTFIEEVSARVAALAPDMATDNRAALDAARWIDVAYLGVLALSAGGFLNIARGAYGRVGTMLLAQYGLLGDLVRNARAGKLTDEQVTAQAQDLVEAAVQVF